MPFWCRQVHCYDCTNDCSAMHRIGGIPNNCKCLWIQVGREPAGGSTAVFRDKDYRHDPEVRSRCLRGFPGAFWSLPSAPIDQRVAAATASCRPALVRAAVTEDIATRCTFPALLAFISPTACNSSLPMFRFASRFRSAVVLIFAIDRFLEFSQNIRRDGITSAFRIHREQPYLTIVQSIEIDHPHATAFFGSGPRPSRLVQRMK
jgi:hypothetical protein